MTYGFEHFSDDAAAITSDDGSDLFHVVRIQVSDHPDDVGNTYATDEEWTSLLLRVEHMVKQMNEGN